RPHDAADHRRDLLAARRVRLEHRDHRARGLRVARGAARGLLRLPAVLRPGAPGRLRQMTVAIVGGGLAGLTAYATLRHGGLAPDEIVVFGDRADPAEAWRERVE